MVGLPRFHVRAYQPSLLVSVLVGAVVFEELDFRRPLFCGLEQEGFPVSRARVWVSARRFLHGSFLGVGSAFCRRDRWLTML